MFRAHHAIVLLLAIPSLAVLGVGCSDDTTAKPQVIFSGNTANSPGKDCRDSGDLFEVGDFGNPSANPPMASVSVADGAAAGQGAASVSCSVVAAGTDTFNVNATVVLTGATGGLFTVEGQFKTTGEQTNIHVIASSKRSANNYDEKDRACIVKAYTGNQGVAAGRVWGTIACPNAVNTADDNRACMVTAEFRFENCGQ